MQRTVGHPLRQAGVRCRIQAPAFRNLLTVRSGFLGIADFHESDKAGIPGFIERPATGHARCPWNTMPLKNTSDPDLHRTNWLVVLLILLGVAVALLPVILHLPPPPGKGAGIIFVYLPALLAVVACYSFTRTYDKREKAEALFLCVAFAFLSTYLHRWLVDDAYPPGSLNWQLSLQRSVIDLRPEVLPHSYRFLPNSIVRLFEQVTGDFSVARDSYRNLFGVLLFFSLYRFARLFLRHGGALFCLALWAVVYPVSFRYYAGQLTDPMSHLAFVLAFIFIETEQFVYLLLTVTIGCLAKETIVALVGYYAFVRWRARSGFWKVIILGVAALAVCAGARLWVLHGALGYQQISGVAPDHAGINWSDYRWLPGLLFTVGLFVPFVIAGWAKSPRTLRALALYLFPVLFISSLFFSWLREARNFMPLVAVLSVLTVYYLVPGERAEPRGRQQ